MNLNLMEVNMISIKRAEKSDAAEITKINEKYNTLSQEYSDLELE